MKDHLLSIFPLQGTPGYARVSCVPLEEDAIDCARPFLVSHDQLVFLLAESFEVNDARAILQKLEENHDIQIPITVEQARHLGFVPKVN